MTEITQDNTQKNEDKDKQETLKEFHEAVKSLPKDLQLYIWKLRKKITSCNGRIDELTRKLKEMNLIVEIATDTNAEHNDIMNIILDYFPDLKASVDKAISLFVTTKPTYNKITWSKPGKDNWCSNCYHANTIYNAKEEKWHVQCSCASSTDRNKEVQEHQWCDQYMKGWTKVSYNGEKKQKKFLCVEDIVLQEENEWEI